MNIKKLSLFILLISAFTGTGVFCEEKREEQTVAQQVTKPTQKEINELLQFFENCEQAGYDLSEQIESSDVVEDQDLLHRAQKAYVKHVGSDSGTTMIRGWKSVLWYSLGALPAIGAAGLSALTPYPKTVLGSAGLLSLLGAGLAGLKLRTFKRALLEDAIQELSEKKSNKDRIAFTRSLSKKYSRLMHFLLGLGTISFGTAVKLLEKGALN